MTYWRDGIILRKREFDFVVPNEDRAYFEVRNAPIGILHKCLTEPCFRREFLNRLFFLLSMDLIVTGVADADQGAFRILPRLFSSDVVRMVNVKGLVLASTNLASPVCVLHHLQPLFLPPWIFEFLRIGVLAHLLKH